MTNYSKHFLTVGSLLRDPELLSYRKEIEGRDDITYPFYDDIPGYKAVEDRAVADALHQQLAHGLTEVSDGEQGRSLWHLDFAWGLDGVRRYINDIGYFFHDDGETGACKSFETRKDIGLAVDGKLSGKNHAFIDQYKRLQELFSQEENKDFAQLKFTIPAPAHLYAEFLANEAIGPDKYYSDHQVFLTDLVAAYKEFISEYAALGVKIIQIDDCIWSIFAGDGEENANLSTLDLDGDKRDQLAQDFIRVNNEVADYAHELGLKVYGHNCRGNYASRSNAEGTYEEIAKYFLAQLHYDRFYLEWDDERAGSLAALAVFKDRPEVEVVVGALSSKSADLDDPERALALLEEASQYIDKDKLYLSHQCGFASCDCGNELTADNQWAKIDQGHEIAYQFFNE
ncbi:5-methyltetrahydropteroyltriglutamate--homocysteine methyltransferase [Aerococcus urinaehominis]|uniref:5-methyltetrahydropteroyltriglutamate--homocysteine methyltransferase n=1 Tax=Aerococcus urinaehominis TaxID=128944 RepID=A0A0X8FJP9_9LACT|nr:cobalamin-independent methionine synthase II family protein [Aerococcus urinaehominis]AMB98593.1 5-methyltetrahydropteroyltriglutamate--homocysteine methyltransferase [Aerococcus urinaehominis]SDL76529.1 Methionine synthase II (cobalamin-independent) [Aerococcus urinaehominis]